ncbi:iron transporter [Massilia sp. Root351]|jgi:hypothetical protein|uniref:DUF3649 domain-containing protein n=1 Tax=Massilia sp. Root351 TaxID=1736522 RepID=UPI00070F2A05|nr:DUF3649 domain-containing protein [Massilia sp. Root351]KQV80077.1 iron transporter [Massilia sp. Root351]
MRVPTLSAPLAYRLGVGARAVAAIIGGYLLAAAAAAFLALLLPLPPLSGLSRADAVMAATLFSFTVYACAVLWAFAARSAARAWLGLLLPAAVLAGAANFLC